MGSSIRTPLIMASAAAALAASCAGETSLAAQESPIELTGPTFFALQVGDVDDAAAWYAATFAAEVVRTVDAEDGRFRIRILRAPNLAVELIETSGSAEPPSRHRGLFKTGLYVVDVAAAHRRLLERGVDADEQIFVDETLGARSFVMRDPFGNRLQLFEPCGSEC